MGILIGISAALFAISMAVKLTDTPAEEAASAYSGKYTLVIDAGHGGIDGGAVSASGLKESDINLSIALKTEALASVFGVKTAMTRTEDTDYSERSYSEHNNLVKRAEFTNSIDGAVLLSIHQNTFPDGRVSGAEVLYAETDGSERLGNLVQDNLIALLDPFNRRLARPAPKALLLTSSVDCPAILVECGFLSNEIEAEKLSDDGYQKKTAIAFIASYLCFLSENRSF